MSRLRPRVLWFGDVPDHSTQTEYAHRELSLQISAVGPLPDPALACAAVFNFELASNPGLVAFAKAQVARLLDYGLRVDVVAADDAGMGRLQAELGKTLKLPGLHARTGLVGYELAEGAARSDAGKVPRVNLEIVVAHNREPIRAADVPLFQRAFARCKRIALVELTGGLSNARVFAVHMTVDESNAGVWPQPAFAKLDRRDNIEKEFINYREYADRFIPFGLRPNIDALVAGSEHSLLVGDFVDRSESLWDLVRRNVAGQAVSALFDETLGGWRNQAYRCDPVEGSVAQALASAGVVKTSKIKSRYVEQASRAGITATTDELWSKLIGLKQRYRKAAIHGDLHGENVRVRNGQAILIDLASVSVGPLTADLAALEAWLAFELPPEAAKHEFENPSWANEIDRLYEPMTFLHPPGPCDPISSYCWMATVVRQIRYIGIATQSCATEYQTAVAVQLLRRCQWDDGPTADRYRRGHGYIVAARLIDSMTKQETGS